MEHQQSETVTMEILGNDVKSPLRTGSYSVSQPTSQRDTFSLSEELLTVLLHDLRSPLGAIGVLADVISTAVQVGHPLEPRQLSLLQEAVIKAQRILDDAVEFQSIARGTTHFTPSIIEMRTLVRNSLEKARHAPYFRNASVDYEAHAGDQIVMVDIEKVETILLSVLEHISNPDAPESIQISHYLQNGNGYIQFRTSNRSSQQTAVKNGFSTPNNLRSRLGNRRLGESRFNLLLCGKILQLMNGQLDQSSIPGAQVITIQLPLANQ